MARVVIIARRSLNELPDALLGAMQKGHITRADLVAVNRLLKRLYPAMSGWLAYLTRTQAGRRIEPLSALEIALTSTSREPTDQRSRDRTDARSRVRTNQRSQDPTNGEAPDRTARAKPPIPA
jgi:hypothetical protein